MYMCGNIVYQLMSLLATNVNHQDTLKTILNCLELSAALVSKGRREGCSAARTENNELCVNITK